MSLYRAGERPAITDLDDLVDIDAIGAVLGYKRGRIREFMRGIDGKPPLPHVKIGRVPFFSKRQVAWWINQLQQQVDPVMDDIRRATREQDNAAR